MTHYVGLDVSQKLTSICIVDATGRKLWRGQCASDPEQIARVLSARAPGCQLRFGLAERPAQAVSRMPSAIAVRRMW
jgi:transposase